MTALHIAKAVSLLLNLINVLISIILLTILATFWGTMPSSLPSFLKGKEGGRYLLATVQAWRYLRSFGNPPPPPWDSDLDFKNK